MKQTALWLVLLGLATGLGLGTLIGDSGTADAPHAPELERLRARVAELEETASTPSALLEGEGRAAAPTMASESPTPAPAVGASASDQRVRELADKIRKDAERQLATADQVATARVALELARERAKVEDLARGGTMTFLRGLEQDFTPPFEMLDSAKSFGALFEPRSSGGRVAGDSISATTELTDGDTILYPRGRHLLQVRHVFNKRTPLPKDLVIEGHGMDETLLVLSSDISVRSEIHNLTFRDVTIHCNDNYMDRSRSNPFTLRLERCRVVGFDMGAGGSCMLGGSVGAFFASDCRFEAGFGRSPGSGNLFDVRGMLLGRMERCAIVGPFRSVFRGGRRSAYQFEDCTFTNVGRGLKTQVERAEHARFPGCTFAYLTDEAARTRMERRAITELNTAWAAPPR